MVDIQSAAAEIRRGKKKKEEDRNHRAKVLWPALLHRAAIITFNAHNRVNGELSDLSFFYSL